MVRRVYGKLDGVDIILHQDSLGKWSIPIPLSEDGIYIVEIIAEDDAGNTSYLSKMLFSVNNLVLTAYLIPLDYQGEVFELYDLSPIQVDYRGEVFELYDAYFEMDIFTTELVIYFTTHCLGRLYSAEVLDDL